MRFLRTQEGIHRTHTGERHVKMLCNMLCHSFLHSLVSLDQFRHVNFPNVSPSPCMSCARANQVERQMDSELYDEFGNYIGPDVDEEEDEDVRQHAIAEDEDDDIRPAHSPMVRVCLPFKLGELLALRRLRALRPRCPSDCGQIPEGDPEACAYLRAGAKHRSSVVHFVFFPLSTELPSV